MTSKKLIIISIVIFIIGLIGYLVTPIRSAKTYKLYADVTDVDNGVVTVVDTNGNEWCYYDDEVQKGDLVWLTLNDNGTDRIEDDEIIKASNLSLLTR